jgi:hypothetical protein
MAEVNHSLKASGFEGKGNMATPIHSTGSKKKPREVSRTGPGK